MIIDQPPGQLAQSQNAEQPRLSCCGSPAHKQATVVAQLFPLWCLSQIVQAIQSTRHVWSIPKATSFMLRSLLRASCACLDASKVLSTFSSRTCILISLTFCIPWWPVNLDLLHVFPDVVILLHQVLVNSILHLQHYLHCHAKKAAYGRDVIKIAPYQIMDLAVICFKLIVGFDISSFSIKEAANENDDILTSSTLNRIYGILDGYVVTMIQCNVV